MTKIAVILIGFTLSGCASLKQNESRERNPSSIVTAVTPRLFIQPSPLFDKFCQKTPFQVDEKLFGSLIQEVYSRLGLFQNEWDLAAVSIVPESEKAAGRKFSRKEYSVALSACNWTPMADPVFLVSALPYIGAPRVLKGFNLPFGMNEFVSMTHHELLHSLVDNIMNAEFSNSSAMVIKYQFESQTVLEHLHLMALQKVAYQRLNNKALLEATDRLYAFIGGDYQRAWTIIGLEGAEKFVSEIHKYNSKKK